MTEGYGSAVNSIRRRDQIRSAYRDQCLLDLRAISRGRAASVFAISRRAARRQAATRSRCAEPLLRCREEESSAAESESHAAAIASGKLPHGGRRYTDAARRNGPRYRQRSARGVESYLRSRARNGFRSESLPRKIRRRERSAPGCLKCYDVTADMPRPARTPWWITGNGATRAICAPPRLVTSGPAALSRRKRTRNDHGVRRNARPASAVVEGEVGHSISSMRFDSRGAA